MAYQAGAYPDFCSMKQLGVFLLPSEKDVSPSQGYPAYPIPQHLSAYDMKNIFCIFERAFEIQKNGILLFEISFFVLEILTFLYYAN